MIKKYAQIINFEILSALMTWAFVSGSIVYLLWQRQGYFSTDIGLIIGLFVSFITAWQLSVRNKNYKYDIPVRSMLITFEYLVIVSLFILLPYTYSYIAILVIIWCCQLPYYMSFNHAILLSPVWFIPFGVIYSYYWEESTAFLSTMLYWLFSVFALVMIHARLKEIKATESANELNRALMATQTLLTSASKQAERVRIARNIHDLLGHHLTALTINLQVAARISEGEVQQKIEECHGLAKLLLSDVREAVSEIREKSNLQLKSALTTLIDNVPKLNVSLEYHDSLQITDVNLANTILCCVQECITNSLKHSNASHFKIIVNQGNNSIQLDMQDNGMQIDSISAGSGITGIQERVAELGGKVKFSALTAGFEITIELPEPL